MENNQVYEADAGIDAQLQSHGKSKNGGAEAMMAATGEFDPNISEEDPLLQHPVDRQNRGNGNGGDTSWAGAADLEGLTWWNRPSVSMPSFNDIIVRFSTHV